MTDLELLRALRDSGMQYDWRPRVEQVDAGGACGVNRDYDAGRRTTFYVEQQDCAEDVVVPALLDEDPAAVERGLQALERGLAQQQPDGSFRDVPDQFHSATLFLASAARVVLLVRSSGFGERFAARLDAAAEGLLLGARRLAEPEVLLSGRASDGPYGHRRFLLGAALGLVGAATGDRALETQAREAVRDGLGVQRPEGWVPELGGPDTHYQAYGIGFATVWLLHHPGDPLRPALTAALDRAVAWEAARVDAGGIVSTDGNTRTDGQERYRDGTPKRVNYYTVVRALAAWGLLRDAPDAVAAARRAAAYKRANPQA